MRLETENLLIIIYFRVDLINYGQAVAASMLRAVGQWSKRRGRKCCR